MHVGFIIKQLSESEIKSRAIRINDKDREMFPRPGILFFIESYDELYGAYLTEDGYITGLEDWFDKMPIVPKDYVIISRYSEGYLLTTTSELIKEEKEFEYMVENILSYDIETVPCPNCRHTLEYARSRDDYYVLKCPKCGFTLVKSKR